jgi:hypothetical protein
MIILRIILIYLYIKICLPYSYLFLNFLRFQGKVCSFYLISQTHFPEFLNIIQVNHYFLIILYFQM